MTAVDGTGTRPTIIQPGGAFRALSRFVAGISNELGSNRQSLRA
jgi:hypothetical protein